MTTTALTHSMTEDQLLTAITEAATLYGWRWHHVRRSDKALQQGHPGFPDLVLVREGRVLFLELKAHAGRLRQDQVAWFDEINGVPASYPDAFLIRPKDLDTVLGWLR